MLRSGKTIGEVADLWSEFLTHVQRSYTKLRIACRAGSSKGWCDQVFAARNADDLLKYVLHARNADEHGVAAITHQKEGAVTKANAVSEGQSLGFRLVPANYGECSNTDFESVIIAVETDPSEASGDETGAHASRSQNILKLINGLAQEGVVNRKMCLDEARDRKLIVGKSPASTAEQFRRVLGELETASFILFDTKQIRLVPGATPNKPNGPP
jgi:hypothetical protein